MLLLPVLKPPHPAAAVAVNVTGVALAVPPVVGVTVSQAATGLVLVSTVNGVPPVAADVIETVCAAPGVYVLPFFVQTTVTALGLAVSPDVVAVNVVFTVTVTSVPAPVLK